MARILGSAVLIVLGIGIASLGLGQGSLTPPGAPAPTMKSLQQVSDQLTTLTALNPVQKFNGYAFVPAPTVSGGLSCVDIPIPAGSLVKLEAIVGATYNDATPIAYLRYLVKEGSSSSRILAERVISDTAMTDPIANTRTFNEATALWIGGGTVFDVQPGDAHTPRACVQSSTGSFATGAFTLTGTYIIAPAAGVGSAAKNPSTVVESVSESDPTLVIQKRVQPAQPNK